MDIRVVRSALCVAILVAGTARAASAQTCITIDEPRDTLAREERTAAVLLVGKQFELAGQRVVEGGCAATYTLSHIRIGATIVVTLSGPLGSREGTALGLDDLPAVYSQMVRSLRTGQPMGTLTVLDRKNVSATQDQLPRRVQSEGYWYARLGHGSVFGESTDHSGAFGFGYRAEFDRVGLDFSFLNLQRNTAGYYSPDSTASSLIKLEGLYFTNPTGNRTAYFGGGLSYGQTELRDSSTTDFPTTGHGGGLQGELTAGYEIARVTSVRLFAQADVTLPFYNVVFERISYPQGPPINGIYARPTITTTHQYAPSLVVSVGFGWQRRPR